MSRGPEAYPTQSKVRTTKIRGGQFFGIPRSLAWGLLAVVLFMAGDGMETAFLTKYMTTLGLSSSQSAHVVTSYGVAVTIASWLAGVLAQAHGPRKVMAAGLGIWIVSHVLFLVFGLQAHNYVAMLVLYGVRGLGYPLFAYAFIVWIAYAADKRKLARAMGMYWFAWAFGYGVIGSYLPSAVIPVIGYQATLWMELGWIVTGGVLGLTLVRGRFRPVGTGADAAAAGEQSGTLQVLVRGITILARRPRITVACGVRTINALSMYGLPVMMPIFLTDPRVGFTVPQWLQIWAWMFLAIVFTTPVWGIVADRIGWARQVGWFGCVGTAVATVLFYYVPVEFGANYWALTGVAVLLGITLGAFIPMSAIMASLAPPDDRGPAMAIHNIAAGLSNAAAPAIVGLVLPLRGDGGVIWVFAILYLVAAVLTPFLAPAQRMAALEADAEAAAVT